MAAFVSGWCHQRYRDISGPRGHWGVGTSQSEASEWRVLTNQRPVSALYHEAGAAVQWHERDESRDHLHRRDETSDTRGQ